MKLLGILGMCVALMVAAPACDKDEKKDGKPGTSTPAEKQKKAGKLVAPGFFKKIPADTIFVFANYERLDGSFVDAMAGFMKPMIDAAMPEITQESSEAAAFFAEHADLLTLPGLKKIGISTAPYFAAYTHDLSFVLRVELADGDALFEFVDGLITKYGDGDPELASKTAGTMRYWESPPDEVAMVIGIDKKEFVLAIMPSTIKQEIMPYITGGKTPDKSIIDSKALIKLVAEHGGEKGLGFVDVEAAMKLMMSGNKGLAGSDLDLSGLSKICKDEYTQIAGLMPKFIFGYDRLDSSEMSMYYGVTLRKDVAKRLSEVVRPVPGYDPAAKHDAMMTMGLGLSSGEALSWAVSTSKKLANAPYLCEDLRELNGVLAKADKASKKAPPVLQDIEGFIAVLETFNPKQPMASTGMIALKSSDLDGLLTLATNLVPGLSKLKLEVGADPALVNPKALPIPLEVYAARSKTIVGAAVGDAKKKLPKLLATEAPKDGPFFVMNYNYESLVQIMEAQGEGGIDNKQIADMLAKLGEMVFEMRATKSGLVMRSAVQIN
jgi:hypothetical protein